MAWGRDERHHKRGISRAGCDLGTLTLTVEIAGDHITLATVAQDVETRFYRTFIGMPVSSTQLAATA